MSRDPDCDLCLERDARDALAERVEALTAERDALQAELAAVVAWSRSLLSPETKP